MPMNPKKHHYVPQSALKRFSVDGRGKQVWVFDKRERRAYLSSIRNAGAENYFYATELAGERLVFEGLFENIDAVGPEVLDEIAANRSVTNVVPPKRAVLAALVAVQLLRVKLVRTTLQAIPQQLKDALRGFGIAAADVPSVSEEGARRSSLRQLIDLAPAVARALEQKDLILVEPEDPEERFLIGDNPVVMYNSLPYGNIGLTEPGVEIYLPLSSRLTLGFYCPTIQRKLAAADVAELGRLAPILEALRSGAPVAWEPKAAGYLQELQMQNSHRFVFSESDNFDLVRRMLEWDPELAEVRTRLETGWEGYVGRDDMPDGTWLVIFGSADHAMIPVEEVHSQSDPPWDTYFKSGKTEFLQAVIEGGPLKRILVVREKQIVQERRRVEIVREPDRYCIKDVSP